MTCSDACIEGISLILCRHSLRTIQGVTAVIFVGDSILRSLYAATLDLFGLSAHEKDIKESHKAPALKIGNFHVAFMEYWFQNDISKVRGRWQKLFAGE